MQRDLDALMDWGSTWGMKCNAKKCNIMRVSRFRKPLQHFYSLGNEILEEVSDAKYLGIQIDNKLDWNKHISTVAARGQSKLAFLNRNLKGCPKMLRDTAYILQRLQNMAARIICRCGPRDHVTPLRKELHWLPIEARPVFKILCYTYNAIHGNLPEYMCDLVSVYNPKRCGLRSGNSSIKRLCTVKAKSVKYRYMCYSIAAPSLWNKLPENIRSAETFATFKSH